jgi:hypothetical protein
MSLSQGGYRERVKKFSKGKREDNQLKFPVYLIILGQPLTSARSSGFDLHDRTCSGQLHRNDIKT